MTKTELEEKIKNGESVWFADNCNEKVWEIDLNEKYKPEIYLDQILYVYQNINDRFKQELFIENIYKTKAEAEHYLHHANVTRTETLPFLTWEDIVIKMKNMESFGLNHNDRVLARIITKDSIYYFKLCKSLDLFIFQLKEIYIGDDLCEEIRSRFPISLGEATEQNFYKAYDECVKLFKGE